MRMVAMLCLLGAFWSSQASAQLGEAPVPQTVAKSNTATLEETQRWLEEKISSGGYHRYMKPTSEYYQRNYERVDIFFNDCQFQHVWISGTADAPDEIRIQFGSLASLKGHLRSGHIGIVGDKPLMLSSAYHHVGNDVPAADKQAVFNKIKDGDRTVIAALAAKAAADRPNPLDYFFFMPRTPADPSTAPTFDPALEQRIFNAFEHASEICRARDLAARDAELAKSAKRADEPF